MIQPVATDGEYLAFAERKDFFHKQVRGRSYEEDGEMPYLSVWPDLTRRDPRL